MRVRCTLTLMNDFESIAGFPLRIGSVSLKAEPAASCDVFVRFVWRGVVQVRVSSEEGWTSKTVEICG